MNSITLSTPDPLTTDHVVVDVGPLRFADVVAVARLGAPVVLAPRALAAMAESAAVIAALASDTRPHYGVSTGFGALAAKQIPVELRAQLQRSLVRSHAAGSGPEVEREVVRALMLLRLSTLATGRTGVRPLVAQTYAAVLNAGITPIVGEYGSLGCSGDLAPLAHCALALLGEGQVRDADGTEMPAADALAAAGIEPVELVEKEGLSLINGTDGMLGMLVLALTDLKALITTADLAAGMSVEALLGTDAVFAADLQELRPHPGQRDSAANIRAVLAGSGMLAQPTGFTRVQDAYSLRCAPQVHGGVRDTIEHATRVAERELGSAVDNPAVTLDGRVESNGNFHGAPVAYALDFLAIVAADLASMSERRTDRFLDVSRGHGLPAFLADDPGVDSGHMIAQYTQAGIVSELKRLGAPASVDSIPSSAMQEDHVSMGWSAARKLRRSVDGLSRVLAIEILTSARAMDMRRPLAPGPVSAAVVRQLRTRVPAPGTDRYLAPEIARAHEMVCDGSLLTAARGSAGTSYDRPVRLLRDGGLMSVVAGLLGELSDVGRVPAGGYDRLAWTPVDLECRQWFHQCADALDLEVETDRNGNLWAWWAPELAGPAFVAGSHLDSVPNGGAYDGALGVASAFAAVALLRREGFVPTRPFAIVAFVDGEGARFGAGRIGSRLMVGSVTAAETLGLTDRDGTTMAEAMTSAGRDVSDVGRDDALLRRIGEFVELHIEQGHMPTRSGGHHGLAAAGSPVGVADRILPHGRWRVDVVGRQDHAGTTPMRARRDPMIGLARVILTVREAAVTHGAQASVGKTHITPGAVETVAAAATLWIDASASTANAVQRVVTDVRMRTGLEPAQESWSAGVEFDPAFTAAAAAILGDAPVLASGGSHDAGVLAGAGIPSTMLWVRNASGISHSASEHVGDDDCEAGVEALIALIRTRTSAAAEDLFHFNQ